MRTVQNAAAVSSAAPHGRAEHNTSKRTGAILELLTMGIGLFYNIFQLGWLHARLENARALLHPFCSLINVLVEEISFVLVLLLDSFAELLRGDVKLLLVLRLRERVGGVLHHLSHRSAERGRRAVRGGKSTKGVGRHRPRLLRGLFLGASRLAPRVLVTKLLRVVKLCARHVTHVS